MAPVNRIITRGMGTSRGKVSRAGLVTQGYGGIFRAALEEIRRIVRVGQSGAKRAVRELEEVIVWAKLVRVNDEAPAKNIEGFVRAHIKRTSTHVVSLIEHVSTRVRKVWEDVRISIKRLK